MSITIWGAARNAFIGVESAGRAPCQEGNSDSETASVVTRSRRRGIRATGEASMPAISLSGMVPATLFQRLPRAHQRVAFPMYQTLDLQRHFHVTPPVKALAGSAFIRPELRKLRFPEPQNVSFHLANAGHVSNFEIETIRDRRCLNNAFAGKLCSHSDHRMARLHAADLSLIAV
jgi:hypothetical protein